ncbi:flagellar hook-basal body complex protein FliE [Maridesulfovibrio ferrireducens]|uniref:Flagellar hook-basal body complex protein FliE n=1 Tax=Maridesulfovibrio ferrireducens TaxID=246191 RepID=A0A1G9FA24_9BACT|nr:flagellar hook-basal body complex protein FliE [Maridesulfovibrio ferrireducens]MBI9110940.1 flagellar hook-basal body complex protein FliE [Maridesulfovibrio ferrireducens]SDK85249.1 flagellar hook-basal body complex protein FliE [Maridesulfovibrio ferrireducens]
MSIKNVAMQAYSNALQTQNKFDKKFDSVMKLGKPEENSFTETLKTSLTSVNDLQTQKKSMIEDFASGKNQNVHELMISLQKAGLAMSMTSTVRSKVMTAYQEVLKMPF